MNFLNFINHLRTQNCFVIRVRETAHHSIYQNQTNKKITSIITQEEIKNNLVRKICKDLEISLPSNFQ